ncbi:hypothetical protein BU23DRAFT_449678 [Bimuria novae-zelandiae CBS 107.79]|uniref:Uncharacterized protein n=1 Tax=Bimuria novae-zelandiae CBS 107.79 TaxID=1447943 RepID=A0A6A5VZC4_9PLEO|nr:hypothetical protein BU23DRAFT_449678 [Bimuria novae-zelandiae CBS 107.79]
MRRPAWFQCGAKRRVKHPYYHLVWPKDKDRGKFGRLKDILQGKGPDIHLTMSAKRQDYDNNRPLHGNWTGWDYLDWRITGLPGIPPWPGQFQFPGPSWADRKPWMKYNFKTRKYESLDPIMCTGAIWQGPRKNTDFPDQYRNVWGDWRQNNSWNPAGPGQDINDI